MNEYIITQILNMDNLSEEQKSALLGSIADELIENKKNIQEDPMAKHDMVAEENRKHTEELKEKVKGYKEKLSKLATLKNKLGEPVYTEKDLEKMKGFEIEHLYSTVFEKNNNEGRLTVANPKKIPNKIVNIPSRIRENNGEFHVVDTRSMDKKVVNVFPGTLEELRACGGLEPEEKPRKRVAKIVSLLTNLKEKIVNKFKAFIEKRRANKEQFNVSANEDSDVVDRLVSRASEPELKAVSR